MDTMLIWHFKLISTGTKYKQHLGVEKLKMSEHRTKLNNLVRTENMSEPNTICI